MFSKFPLLGGHRWPPKPDAWEATQLINTGRSRQWTCGAQTADVERQMTEITGAPYAVAFSSCTSAIHAGLFALGCQPGTAVTCPAFTFAGTVTGARHIGARIVFTDVDPLTLNGKPAPVPGSIALVTDLHGVPHGGSRTAVNGAPVLTDSCQALGSTIRGSHVGESGMHAWSFSSAKIIAAPDGGAITTSSPDQAALLRELRDYGIRDQAAGRANAPVVHPGGHNWRPTELSMAMVAARLQKLPGYVRRARDVTGRLHATLGQIGMWRQTAPPGTAPAWHKVRFGPAGWDPARCSQVEQALTAAGIPTHRWGAVPLHRHPAFQPPAVPELPVAEAAAAGTLCLGTEECPPMTWTDEEVEHVCQVLERTIGEQPH